MHYLSLRMQILVVQFFNKLSVEDIRILFSMSKGLKYVDVENQLTNRYRRACYPNRLRYVCVSLVIPAAEVRLKCG